MTKVVRPFITSSSAAVTRISVTGSSALVASSRIRIGGSFSNARRWRAAAARRRTEACRVRRSGLQTFRIAVDEVERLGARRRLADFGVAGVRLADAQILGDRAVEQQRFLKHHADIAAQARQREVADIDAVDLDRAGLRIEGAMQQRERGRFAAAGRADQSDAFAGQHGEGQIGHRGALAVIGQ